MDYSSYSIPELQESLSNIDKHAYPDRYQKLLNELEVRKEEVEQYQQNEEDKFHITVHSRLNILAWLQIITCIGFLYVGVASLFEQVTLLNVAILLAASILNGLAGYLLLKRKKSGFHLSLFNQVAQLLSLNLGFIYYSYSGLGYLAVVLQDGISLKASLFDPLLHLLWGSHLGFGVGLDLVSLFFVGLLSSCKNEKDTWKK
ncbi:hypothetical protein EXT46_05775 [Pseudoalteromonas sp. CO325X]|uniref:hypothetical protein n=1 Tax=Pseudoalteromonas sp. CO325X TaxID=1777262 RepID=UPI001023B0D0|nr:hypothetical protein [Pseudoalteromonas sp. CO325X]RZF82960.1 hypothetical protein EXT46_05775 [Pseudoalteromonas sp. CO325X]